MGKQKKDQYLKDMLSKPLAPVGFGSRPNYWETADHNSKEVQLYRDWILALAMQRYEWEGLPATCDSRYIEWVLTTQGVATIAFVDPLGWVSTQAALSGAPNIYDNPTSWESIGNNGHHAHVTPNNGVLIWSNYMRFPEWNFIDIYARRLAQYDITLEANLVQQKIPWILKGPYERQNDMVQMIKQAAGGEPAVIGMKSINEIEVDLMATPVEFKGEELQNAKARTWSEVYTFLGIDNLDRKGERMIEDEVNANNDPVENRLLDGLSTRRQAAEILNERFGLEVQVIKKKDNESDNFNIIHNIADAAEVLGEGGKNADSVY